MIFIHVLVTLRKYSMQYLSVTQKWILGGGGVTYEEDKDISNKTDKYRKICGITQRTQKGKIMRDAQTKFIKWWESALCSMNQSHRSSSELKGVEGAKPPRAHLVGGLQIWKINFFDKFFILFANVLLPHPETQH